MADQQGNAVDNGPWNDYAPVASKPDDSGPWNDYKASQAAPAPQPAPSAPPAAATPPQGAPAPVVPHVTPESIAQDNAATVVPDGTKPPSAAPPKEGTLSKMWDWVNTPVNVGHLRESLAQGEADSNAAPTMYDVDHPTTTLIRKGLEGFGSDVGKMITTPLGIALAGAGTIARGAGVAAQLARAGLVASGLGFGANAVKDAAQKGVTPNKTIGEKGYDDPAYLKRVLMDAAMATGGAAGVTEMGTPTAGDFGARGVKVGNQTVGADVGYRPAQRVPGVTPEGEPDYSAAGSTRVPGKVSAGVTVAGRRFGTGEPVGSTAGPWTDYATPPPPRELPAQASQGAPAPAPTAEPPASGFQPSAAGAAVERPGGKQEGGGAAEQAGRAGGAGELEGQGAGTDSLPKSLQRKSPRVLSLAHDGHMMGTIAHDTRLSFSQVDRILRAARLREQLGQRPAAQGAVPADVAPQGTPVAPAEPTAAIPLPAKTPIQGSSDTTALRASAEEHHPTLKATIQGAIANIPGAKLDGSRVKSAESMETANQRGTPNEGLKDVLGLRVAVDTPEAGKAAIAAIAQNHQVVGQEPLDANGLKGQQLFIQSGKPGDAHQVAEVQIIPAPQVKAMDKTTPIYEAQKKAEAAGNDKKAEALGDKAEEIHKAALAPVDKVDTPGTTLAAPEQPATSERQGGRGESPAQAAGVAPTQAAPAVSTSSRQIFYRGLDRTYDSAMVGSGHFTTDAGQSSNYAHNPSGKIVAGHLDIQKPMPWSEAFNKTPEEIAAAGYDGAIDYRPDGRIYRAITTRPDQFQHIETTTSEAVRSGYRVTPQAKPAPTKIAKGSQVTLPDGRTGTVDWLNFGKARVSPASGAQWRGNAKDLKPAAPVEGVTSGVTPEQTRPSHGAIAVDLDNTIATYSGYKGPTEIGKPMPEVENVKRLIAEGKDVWIYTARADKPEAISAIKAWTKEHIGKELPVTNVKYPEFQTFIDDRAQRPGEGGQGAGKPEAVTVGAHPEREVVAGTEQGERVGPGGQGGKAPAAVERPGGKQEGGGAAEQAGRAGGAGELEGKAEASEPERSAASGGGSEVGRAASEPRPERPAAEAAQEVAKPKSAVAVAKEKFKAAKSTKTESAADLEKQKPPAVSAEPPVPAKVETPAKVGSRVTVSGGKGEAFDGTVTRVTDAGTLVEPDDGGSSVWIAAGSGKTMEVWTSPTSPATPAAPITEAKAVAPGTAPPSELEGMKQRRDFIRDKIEALNEKNRASNAEMAAMPKLAKDKTAAQKARWRELYKEQEATHKERERLQRLDSEMSREITEKEAEVTRQAQWSGTPLTEPEEKIVTDPDKDKWGYQREYFMKALEPVKQAWIGRYTLDNGKGWTWDDLKNPKGQHVDPVKQMRPNDFPDEFIRIEVPKDGKFLVKNAPPAIDRILKSAPSAFSKPREATHPKLPSVPRAPKEFDVSTHIASLKKEIAQLEDNREQWESERDNEMLRAARENLKEAQKADPAPEPLQPYDTSNPEAGFMDIKPLLDMAAPLREELEHRSEIAGVAHNVHDALQRLDRTNKAATLEAKGIARAFEEAGFTKSDGDKVFAHIEDPKVKLTPKQEELRDKWIKPLDKRAADQRRVTLLIKSLSDKDAQKRRAKDGTEFTLEDILSGNVPPEEVARYAPEQENYQHRIPVDKNTFVDRILGDSMKRFRAGGSSLARTFSSGNRSVFYEIHGPNGEREAVAVKGGRVTQLRPGTDGGKSVATDLGAFRSGLTDAGKETDERMMPFVQRITELRDEIAGIPEADRTEQLARVQDRIAELKRQMALLDKVKAPVGKTQVYGGKTMYTREPTFGQRAAISRKLDDLYKREERLKNKTEPMLSKNQKKMEARKEELKGNEDFRDNALMEGEKIEGSQWRDKNGQLWKFNRGTTDFITKQTGQKYHANAMLSSLVNYMETNKAMNAAVVMERLKGLLADQGMAIKTDNPTTVPDGWKGTTLMQMRGHYFPAHIADALDQFDYLQSRGKPNIAERVNRFIISTVLMNPLMHGKNIAANYFTGKAAEAITGSAFRPSWYKGNMEAGVKAVNTLKDMGGPEYRRLLRLGLDLQGASTSFDQTTKDILRSFTDELVKNPDQGRALSALMGVANVPKWFQNYNHLATFGINDLFLLQSYYAREAQLLAQGMSPDLAEPAARDWAHQQVAEYTTPVRVGGSAALGRILENPNLSAFWRYHFGGILRPVMTAVSDAVGSFKPDENMTEAMGGALGRTTDTASGQQEETYGERNARGQTRAEARTNAIARLLVMTAFATVVFPKVLDKLARRVTGDAQAKFPRGGELGFASNVAETVRGERDLSSTLGNVFTPAIGTEEALETLINRDFFTGRHIMGTNVDTEDKVKQLASWLGTKTMPGQLTHRWDQGRGKQVLFGLLGFTFPMEHGLLEAAKIRSEAAGSNPADPTEAKIWQSILAAAEQAQRSGGKDTRLKDALLKSGVLKPSQRKELIAAAHNPPIVFATSDLEHDADVWQVFEHSTDEEKRELLANPETHVRMLKYVRQLKLDNHPDEAAKVDQELKASH